MCFCSSLQAQFKQQTGVDYKPGMAPPTSAPAAPAAPSSAGAVCPYTRVSQQGELVRKLKAEQAPKVPDVSPVHAHVTSSSVCVIPTNSLSHICSLE